MAKIPLLPVSGSDINGEFGSNSLLTARNNVSPAWPEMDSNNPFWPIFTPFPLTGPVSYSNFQALYKQDGNGVQFTSGYDAATNQYGYSQLVPVIGSLVGSTQLLFPDGGLVRGIYHDATNNNLTLYRNNFGNNQSNAAFKSLRINGYNYTRASANYSISGSIVTYKWFASVANVMANNTVYTILFSTTE